MTLPGHGSRAGFAVLFVCTLVIVFPASTLNQSSQPPERQAPRISRDPKVQNIVREIDARNIERAIRKLVSFGTRNTLSEQDNPNRGIGAARDWLYSQFQKAAQESGGRMKVEKQTFEQPKAARVPQPTMLTNVVAKLRGTQPESESVRIIVRRRALCENSN